MLDQLEATISAEMERTGLTGLSIALIQHGEVVWVNGYGLADLETREPMAPDTVCGIMSVTKPIIGTAVMQLRDAGRFALDDPINPYLAPVSIKNAWEDKCPVTIRHLLTHTGGLPVGIGADPPGRHELAEYVDLAARTSWQPGSRMVYANWGYAALGLLIEKCSGKSVGDYLRDAILSPLVMTTAGYGQPEGQHATGHFVSLVDGSTHALPMDEWPIIPTSPAGGCWSTVMDLAKFLESHLGGGYGILAPGTVREMHQVHAQQGNGLGGMGLGFRVTRSNGQQLICHGGDGGGFTAFAGFYPDHRVGVALLINTGGMQAARSVIANTALALPLEGPVRRRVAVTGLNPGLYRSTFWDIVAELRDDPATVTVSEGLVVLDETCDSDLLAFEDGSIEGDGGMFHGFEVTLNDEDAPALYGGVYPFEFLRTGAIPEPLPLDVDCDVTGTWGGTIHTPIAPLSVTLGIESETAATITTPLGPATIDRFRAGSGQIEGEFPLAMPGVGDFRNFLRLEARGGRLVGKTYARSKFGENAMWTELDRA